MVQRKKLDSRISTLIQNGINNNHRSFYVIVGDKGKDQVVTLHYLLSKQRITRPSVLWCYKKELGFSSHRKKRMNQIKKEIARGKRDIDEEDPFELFIGSTNIRYTYYKETEKILGTTFGMCVLQDFEALTPNLLARTIETVEGGGIIVILLKTMNSLKQLYTMTMDVHARYRTEANQDTVARFNERFILSLGDCESCLVVDDELNVLPLSAGKNVVQNVPSEEITPAQKELQELKDSLADTQPVGSLIKVAKTVDQAKAVLTFIEAIAEKTLKSTVALTAARGRGKSAALGISLASAVAYGYSNIFLTSPSPENLKTLFEFVLKGFDALGYEEHLDYDIIQSTNPSFQKAIVRINIFKDHRQTIQWIQPNDYQVLAQAELLIIDEAAAIPLPVVKKLLGPYLVFMASTINGYEGTGRSLSLKLIQQLRENSVAKAEKVGRTLREIKLEEPIRYSANDQVELWLNKLLCLDCCTPPKTKASGCPHPSECDLYYVSRDTLFSYHPVSEAFLQMMISLYVASHYKNSPNDLQLMSDAPAHHLFVLLPPISGKSLPEPLVVIQVALEGAIAKGSALASLARGVRSNGDLIPWVVTQQFQDDNFASLSGGRIVRIATHPNYTGMGYGHRAIEMLESYYRGDIPCLNENVSEDIVVENSEISDLKNEKISVRNPRSMPPLLIKLSERPLKEKLDWLGVSYGITQQLHKFWKSSGYKPVYIRQTSNDLTGEHTCIMVKEMKEESWLPLFNWDFRKRFLQLLGYQFREFAPQLVLSILSASGLGRIEARRDGKDSLSIDSEDQVSRFFTPFDLKRLESYSQNLLDYHVILDLVPICAQLYHLDLLTAEPLSLSAVQSCIILGIGLQKKTVEEIESDLQLPVSQILALFGKAIKKISNYLLKVVENQVKTEVAVKKVEYDPDPTGISLEQDLKVDSIQDEPEEEEAEEETPLSIKQQQRQVIDSLPLEKYAISENQDFSGVSLNGGSNRVSLPNQKSTKKRKHDGLSKELVNNSSTVDPKNLVQKVKDKKRLKQQKKDQKKLKNK